MKKITGILLVLLTMVIMTACSKKIDLLGKNIAGTETRYGNGTSDYQIAYTSYTGRILDISIKGFESGLKPSDTERSCQFSYASSDNENMYFCSIGMITEDNQFPFQTASDEEILNAFGTDGTLDMATFFREETETEYRIYRASDREDATPDQGGRQYSLLLYDKKSNALFHIAVIGVGEYADDAVLRKIMDKIEVSLGEFSTEAAETFFAEPGNYDFSGDEIKGTELVSKDQEVDYEVFYEDPVLNKTLKIKVTGTGFTMKPSSYHSDDGLNGCSFTLGTDAENLYELRVFASLPYVAAPLKEVFADGLAGSFAGAADSSTFSKVETDDDWRIYFLIDLDPSMSARKYTKQYNLYVERKNGVSYTVMAYAKGSHANEMLLRKYVDSVEVSLAQPEEPEVPEVPEVKSEIIDISADGMTGTETRYEDGTSDYKVYAGDLLISTNGLMSGCTLSARNGILLEYLPDINGEERCRLYIVTLERDYYPLPLKDTDDKEFGEGFPPSDTIEWDTLSRTETEDAYKVYIVGSVDDLGFQNGKRGVMYIEDKKTNALYQIMAITCGSLADYAKLREIVDSVEVSLAD